MYGRNAMMQPPVPQIGGRAGMDPSAGGIGPPMQAQLGAPLFGGWSPWATPSPYGGPFGLNFGLPAFGAVPPGSPFSHPLAQYPGFNWPGIDESQFSIGGPVENLAAPEPEAAAPAAPQYFHAPGTQDYYSFQNDIWTPLAGKPIGAELTPMNIETAPSFYGLPPL